MILSLAILHDQIMGGYECTCMCARHVTKEAQGALLAQAQQPHRAPLDRKLRFTERRGGYYLMRYNDAQSGWNGG